MNDVVIGKGKILGKGIYANKNFRKGNIVIWYNLKTLTEEKYQVLSKKERMFVHIHRGIIHLYSIPERYVNHSNNPNTIQDLDNMCDVALRNITKDEQITTDATKDDI